jgi:glycosyltransferase involved in cell wall biosynthesis
MGHGSVRAVLRETLTTVDDVEATFVALPPLTGAARLAIRGVPGLRSADLDAAVTRWHLIQGLRARSALERALRAAPADVLHVNSHSIAVAIEDQMARIPTVLSVDATVWDVRRMEIWRPLRRHSRAMMTPSLLLERRALASAAAVVVFSEWAARAVHGINPQARCVELHPGIDLTRFRPAARRPRTAVRVLFVGGRYQQKGGEDLLAAVAPHLGRGVEVDLVTQDLVPAPAGVRVHRLSAGDPKLVDLYQQADIFCLPTQADASPFALLEAMACGAAVVSTEVGAIPEMLDLGRAGVLVAPRDRSALGAAMDRLVSDAVLRAKLGAQARSHVERRFDARRQTVRLVELMRGIAARR